MQLEELATAVATRQPETTAPPPAADDVAVSLHHNHLPMMSSLGVLAYDPEAKLISGTD